MLLILIDVTGTIWQNFELWHFVRHRYQDEFVTVQLTSSSCLDSADLLMLNEQQFYFIWSNPNQSNRRSANSHTVIFPPMVNVPWISVTRFKILFLHKVVTKTFHSITTQGEPQSIISSQKRMPPPPLCECDPKGLFKIKFCVFVEIWPFNMIKNCQKAYLFLSQIG